MISLKIENLFYFLVHINIKQLIYRLFSKFYKPISLFIIKIKKHHLIIEPNAIYVSWVNNSSQLFDVFENSFTFGTKKEYLGNQVNWKPSNQSKLWIFNLNYFKFLYQFIEKYNKYSNPIFIQRGTMLIENWIENCTNYELNLWSPYTTSIRLISWINFYSNLLSKNLISKLPPKIIKSINIQRKYLECNLEFDVLGNHILENYNSLILINYFIVNKKNVNKYLKSYVNHLSKQILKDGCHYEKSFSYHIQVLDGVLNVLINLKNYDNKNLKKLSFYCHHMISFYRKILQNGSNYPLFNDSNYSMTTNIETVNNKIRSFYKIFSNFSSEIKTLSSNSNYYFFKNDNYGLVVDSGTIGPNNLTAHSHNDIFSFEYSIKNEKFIIDTGVLDYEQNSFRDLARSTLSHNTIMLKDCEQSNFWSIFRHGYRPKKIQTEVNQNKNIFQLTGKLNHRSYTHIRTFQNTSFNTLIVSDLIKDNVSVAFSYLHFDPDVIIEIKDNYLIAKKSNSSSLIYIYFHNNFKISNTSNLYLFNSFYFPEFGVKIPRKSLKIKYETKFSGYLISSKKIQDLKLLRKSIRILYSDKTIETTKGFNNYEYIDN